MPKNPFAPPSPPIFGQGFKRKQDIARNLPSLDAIADAMIDKKLSKFMAAAWSIVEPGAKYMSGWHIDAICDHLEAVSKGQIKRLIINIPPRCCKSLTVCVFWPAWVWTWRPHTKWIFASHKEGFALRDALKTRRLIESHWYQQRYPHIQLEKDQNTKGLYQNTLAGQRFSIGVGSGATGEGGDILVVDDPLNAKEALSSEVVRLEAIEWWDGTMSTRINPGSEIAAKLCIMQRLHDGDLTGHLLKKRERYLEARRKQIEQGLLESTDTAIDEKDIDYEILCLPAEYSPTHPIKSRTSLGFKDPRTQKGELLWEAGLPRSRINQLRVELGSYAASGQLDQNPAPEGGGKLKRAWFKLVEKHDWPTEFEEIIHSWDLAFDGKKNNDYCAGFVMGRKGSNVYLITRVKDQLEFVDQIFRFRKLIELYPAAGKYVEKAANASSLYSTLQNEIPGIILLPPHGSKMARAMAWQPYLEAGNIHLPAWEMDTWVDDFLSECEKFPTGEHDDQVDAAGIGILKLINDPSYLPNIEVGDEYNHYREDDNNFLSWDNDRY